MKLKTLGLSALTSATAAALLCMPALGGNPPSDNYAALKAESERWAQAWNRNDVKAVMELYTEDAKLLPEGSDAVAGRESVAQFLQKERTASWPDTISFINIEVYGNGDTATEVSEMEIRGKDGVLKGRGKQILVFVKQGEQWKLHRDIWTGSSPAKPKAN